MEGDTGINHQPDGVGDQPMPAAKDEVDAGIGEVEEAEAPQQIRAARRGLEPSRPEGGVGEEALRQTQETNQRPDFRLLLGETIGRAAARKVAEGSGASRTSGGSRTSRRAEVRPVAHGHSSWAVLRDGSRRRATVDHSARPDDRVACGSRLREMFVGLKVDTDNPGAFGYVTPSYLSLLSEMGFPEEGGALTEDREPRLPKVLAVQHPALGTQEWTSVLILNSQVLLLSAHLHHSGLDLNGPSSGL